MNEKIQKLIDHFEKELEDYRKPMPYQDSRYYDRCDGKADYIEYDVLPALRIALEDK